ncbi:ThiF family adenylyltransferase [Kocuria sp. M1R5S2]|uniref:ThiF family adenylyltransferase n=1 Tax=Kocuria rhizosphaerae TaxID=3376285 RepID=UPI0037910697
MPTPAPPRRGRELLRTSLEDPRPDEVHVLLLGLDGLAAAVAVRLVRCGVLGLNVNDPRPVTATDLEAGAYRPADVGRPREAALRRRLRELDPRCAPVSAPELFPGALLPGTMVVRSAGTLGRATGGEPPEPASLDPRHPLVSLHRHGELLMRWPTVPWAHRPCPDCVESTLDRLEPGAEPRGRARVLEVWARPAHAEGVAAELAVDVLAVALAGLWTGPDVPDESPPGARLFAPPWPEAVLELELDRSRCLCGLDQE